MAIFTPMQRRKVPGRKSLWWLDAPMVERVNALAVERGVRPNKIVGEALSAYLSSPPAEPVMSARSLLGIVKYPATWR
jgi:hypothetical protein